ncbi:MAG TPA: hypothetical protein ENN18_05770 [Proteobacteria bacterium]|nr:hypothetical protein [Pseudomonadota bacterium]
MPLIVLGTDKGLAIHDPDSDAKVGSWCARDTGLVPNLCDRCFDENLAHYPAEGYRAEESPNGEVSLYGICHRCADRVAERYGKENIHWYTQSSSK